MNNEISSIHKAIDEREKESSNQDRNEVRSVRKWKIRLIDMKTIGIPQKIQKVQNG